MKNNKTYIKFIITIQKIKKYIISILITNRANLNYNNMRITFSKITNLLFKFDVKINWLAKFISYLKTKILLLTITVSTDIIFNKYAKLIFVVVYLQLCKSFVVVYQDPNMYNNITILDGEINLEDKDIKKNEITIKSKSFKEFLLQPIVGVGAMIIGLIMCLLIGFIGSFDVFGFFDVTDNGNSTTSTDNDTTTPATTTTPTSTTAPGYIAENSVIETSFRYQEIINTYGNIMNTFTDKNEALRFSLLYVQEIIPQDVWSTFIEDISNPISLINTYLEDFVNHIEVDNADKIAVFVHFKAAVITYNEAQLTGVLYNQEMLLEIYNIHLNNIINQLTHI